MILVASLIAILLLLTIGRWYLFGFRGKANRPRDRETPLSTPPLEIPEAEPEEAPGTPTPGFLDDFEDGLDPVWTVHYGDPLVVNGRLTSHVGAGISAGDASWRNYRVDFSVYTSQIGCTFVDSSNSIGVRVADFDHAYWFVFTSCKAGWSLFPGGILRGEENLFPGTGVSTAPKMNHITIRVEDSEMSAYEDGALLSSLEDSRFETGGVFLQIEAQTFYDNFEVTLLSQ